MFKKFTKKGVGTESILGLSLLIVTVVISAVIIQNVRDITTTSFQTNLSTHAEIAFNGTSISPGADGGTQYSYIINITLAQDDQYVNITRIQNRLNDSHYIQATNFTVINANLTSGETVRINVTRFGWNASLVPSGNVTVLYNVTRFNDTTTAAIVADEGGEGLLNYASLLTILGTVLIALIIIGLFKMISL